MISVSSDEEWATLLASIKQQLTDLKYGDPITGSWEPIPGSTLKWIGKDNSSLVIAFPQSENQQIIMTISAYAPIEVKTH